MKNIQDIIPDRKIIKMKNQGFAGIDYEEWSVSLPIFGDQVETLLENGYSVSILEESYITVTKPLNPSPEKLQQNKAFWNELKTTLGVDG